MAIAYDTATDGGNNSGANGSLTFSHTCTGSNRLLFVGFAGDVTGGADDVSSVTYNGVAMSLVGKVTDGSANRFTYLYVLAAPSSGGNNVVITCAGTHYILGGAVSYTGASATGQPDASTTNTSATSATSLTTSLTTVADNCWTVLVESCYNGNPAPVAGTGATRRTYDAAFGIWGLFDHNAAVTPAGSTSLQTTRTSSSVYKIAHVMASAAPAGAAPTFFPAFNKFPMQAVNRAATF